MDEQTKQEIKFTMITIVLSTMALGTTMLGLAYILVLLTI